MSNPKVLKDNMRLPFLFFNTELSSVHNYFTCLSIQIKICAKKRNIAEIFLMLCVIFLPSVTLAIGAGVVVPASGPVTGGSRGFRICC